ncbi:MAG: Eco57I restriction-modification methylase domain-containing protein [Gemmataceae bacterium]
MVQFSGSTIGRRAADFLNAVESAKRWAREAVKLAGLVRKQGKKESDSQYQEEVEAEATRLINRVVANGEFYLVRAGNTRKGTGTFYTRPQLAVPTVHRTLEPLCYDKAEDGTLVPKEPEVILGLKVCDPACGSASFLVAALHYMADTLYKSLCHHRKLDDPEQAKKLTLPYGRPRTAKADEELVPFSPDDPQRGDTFADRIKALLRRHVVERCIYGVDINPLAVEFARVSLWVETLDPELPFSFLDHKIKVGNSLVGCWLDRVLDYPLKAWEREGGDGKDGPRTQIIETFLKGEKKDGKRSGDGRIKKEMRTLIESQFRGQASMFEDQAVTTDKVVASARSEYECVHNLPIHDTDEREQYYREHVEGSPAIQQLRQGMDEWCAVWFWPTDPAAMAHVPTPQTFHKASAERAAIVQRQAAELKFFHWELAFPDVFTSQRSGFDAMVGNPPWDVIEPNSQEFFTEFDPLYRTYNKQAALHKQTELFDTVPSVAEEWGEYLARFKAFANWARNTAHPFDLALARGKEGTGLAAVWAKHRQGRIGFADKEHPFRLLGTGKQNSYKLFCETFWSLLQHDGRLGVILPTGIYSDFGTKDLRETLLFKGRLDFLYAFQNEKRVFAAAHHAYKQTVVLARKGGSTQSFSTRFRMGVGDSPDAHEIPDDILRNGQATLVFTPDDVRASSPKTLTLVELKTQRDLTIFRKIYANSIRIGDNAVGWELSYAQEINMTSDSKHFPPLDKWEAKGYKQDVFGRWIGQEGDVAVPLYQGAMVYYFNPAFQFFGGGSGSKVDPIV